MSAALDSRRYAKVVIALVLVQAAFWVVLPWLLEGSIRLDSAEGVVDGPEWQLSYLRHPPFSTWLSGLASMTGPFRYAALFLIGSVLSCSAFAIAAGFVARVNRREAGLVALMAGLASPWATYIPIEVNHNIGVMPFWALTLLTGWTAFESGGLAAWACLGLAIGLGLWAKYAILHLVIPLALVFLVVPEWRRQLRTPGPWLAGLLCVAIAAPHFIDVLHKGGTTLSFAVRTAPTPMLNRVGSMAEFIADCLAAQATMAAFAFVACGPKRLLRAIASMFARATMTRLDLYLHAAAFGPVLVIVLAAPLGVQKHFLWVTPLTVSFAAWWGHAAARAGLAEAPRRLWRFYAALAGLFVVSYVAARELAPYLPIRLAYEQTDGPALARLAETYWAEHEAGPIPFIVSLNLQHGFQAAGSIVFDLPFRDRARVVQGDAYYAPWTSVDEIKRRGALVVGTDMRPGTTTLGVEVRDVTAYPRPTLRGAKSPMIYFGFIPPGS
ncbi:MAG: glycosyltransferase family 39 protein [Roseiarcus sp.]